MVALADYGFNETSGSTAADSSGNSKTLTLSGTYTRPAGLAGNALAATTNTGTPATTTALVQPTVNVTIMGWVKCDNLTAGQNRPLFGFSNAGGSTTFGIWAQRGDFGNPNVLQGNFRVGGSLQPMSHAESLGTGTWRHVAMTYDGNAGRLYLDGVMSSNVVITPGTLTVGSRFDVLALADVYTPHATVEEVRVFNTTLSQAEIVTQMNTRTGGSTDVPGSIGFSGAGSLAAVGVPSGAQGAMLSGNGVLSTGATPTTGSGSTLSGVGALTAAGVAAINRTLGLSGEGSLAGMGGAGGGGGVGFSGTGSLLLEALSALSRNVNLSGAGSLSPSTTPIYSGGALFAGSGTLGVLGATIPGDQMAYCDPQDVRNALTPGGANDDTETAAGLEDWQIYDAISEADSIIDQMIGGMYVIPAVAATVGPNGTPVAVAPRPVRWWSRDIAAWLITLTFKRNKDVTEDDPVRQRLAMAMSGLEKVVSGQNKLPVPPFEVIPGSSAGDIEVVNHWKGNLFNNEDYRWLVDAGSARALGHADFGWNLPE